jgi:hypothetical protein
MPFLDPIIPAGQKDPKIDDFSPIAMSQIDQFL